MIYALARSRALRGGIDVALGIELENRELYGPVSYKAYHIESSVAEYPRIVIGPNLLEYLQQLSRSVRQFPGQTDDDIRLCKIGADRCNSMICSDDDGKPILDYLSNSFVSKEQLGEAWDDYHALLMMAKKFVHAEAEIRRSDPKLGPRYKRLKRYFQSRSF